MPAPSSLLTRVAVGISIAVHVVAVLLSLGYAGAGLFEANEPEAVSVSLVTPEDVPAAEPPPVEQKPEPDLGQLNLRLSPIENSNKQPQSQDQQKPQPQKAEQPPQPVPSSSKQQQVAARPAQAAPPAQQAASPPAQSAYTPPQPDLSMKYQVDLGLKMLAAPAPTASAQDGTSDFDAPAMNRAEISGNSIAAFRAKLKQCATLPPQISPDDKVVIVLRATFTPDAKLAADPLLIEASASAKGPALMQAAIKALQSCQPHNALTSESYAEWRVLDLRFTPQDFRKG